MFLMSSKTRSVRPQVSGKQRGDKTRITNWEFVEKKGRALVYEQRRSRGEKGEIQQDIFRVETISDHSEGKKGGVPVKKLRYETSCDSDAGNIQEGIEGKQKKGAGEI